MILINKYIDIYKKGISFGCCLKSHRIILIILENQILISVTLIIISYEIVLKLRKCFLGDFEDRCTIYERSSAPIHIRETIYYHILCAAIAQTYFSASRRECINFYRNTTAASSLSQPETPDRTPTVSGASCKRRVVIQFPLRGFLRGGKPLSTFGVTVSFWEFSRLILVYDLVFISVARVAGFRRVVSPESWGCLTSFHEKLANAPVLSSSS